LDVHGAETPETVRTDAAPAVEAATGDRWGLSERELEVLALVASGRTNGQIGAALFISTKTASVHVTHILDKLGVSSRTEAALVAIQSGVLDRPTDPARLP
jgi:DNA-binding NarL/FixJ family response regulator